MFVYNSDHFVLDVDEIKQLVYGKFTTQQCYMCSGKGFIWVTENGAVVAPPKPEDNCYQHDCEECDNLGFHIRFN